MDDPSILYVEDNPAEARLLERLFAGASPPRALEVIDEGGEVLKRLRREGSYTVCAPADLVLLDLNLPDRPGLQVLAEIRSDPDPRVRATPVIVFTGSDHPDDVARSYAAGANAFVCKPFRLEELEAFVAAVDAFWLQVALGPSGVERGVP